MTQTRTDLRLTLCLSVLAAVFVAGIFAYLLTSGGITDEVYYIEPGVNLAQGRGFVSGFTYQINPDQTWGCSNPGMPLLYALWFSVLGFGFFKSKLLSLLLHLAGVALIVRWTKDRLHFSAATQALVCAGLLAPRTMSWVVVGCRTDVFAALIFGWFLHVALTKADDKPHPWWSALLFGFATVAVGLHFSGYFVLACAAVFCLRPRRQTFFTGLFIVTGVGIGFLATYIGYKMAGAWGSFVESRLWHYQGHEMPWVPSGLAKYTMNPDAPILAFVAMLLVYHCYMRRGETSQPDRAKSALMSLGIFIFVPVVISLIGIYYSSYGWMVWIPMLLLLAPHLYEYLSRIRMRWIVISLLALAVFYACTAIYLVRKNLKIAEEINMSVQRLAEHASQDDKIAINTAAYYRLKRNYPNLYVAHGSSANWPADVKLSIKYILNKRDEAKKAAQVLGGEWIDLSGEHMPAGWMLLARKHSN